MSTSELLAKLRDAQISLALDGESLIVKASKGRITEEIKNSLKRNKEELISILKEDPSITSHSRVTAPIPPNLITRDSTVITPAMLPLIELTQDDIDRIADHVPGGISNIQDIYALTGLQDGILFHHRLTTDNDPYVLSTQLTFQHRVQLDRFLSAVQHVIDRHDILRTAFVWEGLSQPAQVVWRHAKLSTTEIELVPGKGSIARQCAKDIDSRLHRIDLAQPPLLRYIIAREPGSDRWQALQIRHHVIEDAFSVHVFRTEIKAFLQQQGHTLAPPPPFRNLVAQARMGISQDEHEQFFRDVLGEIDEPTLPFGLGDVHQDGENLTEFKRLLPQDLNDRLRVQARRLGVSLASLCHLAWGQVVARASGSERIVFGTVLFGRMQSHGGANEAVGLFINTLPLRVDLDGQRTESAVRQVQQRLAELIVHEHASLGLAQRCSGVVAPTPLFSSILNFRNLTYAEPASEIADIDPLAGVESVVGQRYSNYPVNLIMEDLGDSLGLTVQVVRPLSPDRISAYMKRALESLVEALETNPDRPVRQLEVIPPDERQLLLHEWNATETAYPDETFIHELFEGHAKKNPDSLAIAYEGYSLNYGDLNNQANQLAHYLIGLGLRPDERVAVCAKRTPAMVVGLLGILKAGGAYVPLDPDYPADRLSYMLRDSSPVAAFVDNIGASKLGNDTLGVRVLNLESDADKWSRLNKSNPTRNGTGLKPQNLAYVIYTSGTTGAPKGVMAAHQGLSNYLLWASNAYGPVANSVVSSSLSFDATITSLFTPLISGGAVRLLSEGREIDELETILTEVPGTLLKITPSHLAVLGQRAAATGTSSSVGTIVIGGEALPTSTVKLWREIQPAIRLVNEYGPTETVVGCVIYEVEDDCETIPIGRPIANSRIYLLDEQVRPVPLGALGEIYIGGIGVTRGYLNRARMTAERFLPDPFGVVPGARMYRTGDVARYLPDGNLEFLGRNDHQVKIRGFRIELGEIEARLLEHDLVRQAVVIPREDDFGDIRLVGYIVPTDATGRQDNLAAVLRAHVASSLPDYMVPSAFVALNSIPLTPNGKVDVKSLPAPEGEAYARVRYQEPQTEVERALAVVWQEVLGIDHVGLRDNFFDLGGHSLLAVSLLARLEQKLGVELPIAVVFDQPILEKMAEAVSKATQNGEAHTLPAIVPVGRGASLPLSFAQQRLWFLAQLDGVSATYHIPRALHFRGDLDRHALRQGLDVLMARHESFRTVFVAVEGEPHVELLPPDTEMPFAEHDLRGLPDSHEQLNQLMIAEVRAPFNLARGPLVRACLIRLDGDEYVFLLTQHHIVTDGWSMGVLAKELTALYSAFRDNKPNPLPPLAIQYPDYAAWQRQWLSEERLQHQSDYWRQNLAHAPVLLELPTDRPRPYQQSFSGGYVPISIDHELTSQLKRFSAQRGTTLFMTLVAAWAVVLSRLSGQDDIVIGTPSANRRRHETEKLIGFFVSTLALRIDMSDQPAVAELLERVRTTTLAAQAHQDIPFEQVVELVKPVRRLDHTPVFQVLFAWENNERVPLHLPGIQTESVRSNYAVARFDVSLDLHEDGDSIVGGMNYATALFDETTIVRHCNHLINVLKAVVLDEAQRVNDIDLLGEEERRLLLEDWNATESSYPNSLCIHQLFEEQVERRPNASALLDGDRSLTYAELNERANSLAHYLISLGVKPDDRVAICLNRSSAMVIGLLGILKAGGAYVPLDPSYPTERLDQILRDSSPRIVLSDATGRKALGEELSSPLTVLALDSDSPAWADLPDINPDPLVLGLTSRHLAYVIYTSGSTGIPKGVMNEHRALINRLTWMQNAYNLSESDIVLQKTPFSFDVSVWEFFWTLAEGAKLLVAPPDAHKNPLDIVELIRRWGVTTLHFVPSMLTHFLTANGAKDCTSLRRLICSGEALRASDAQACRRILPHTDLHNLYGPTEAAIDVTAWTCPNDFADTFVPIGRPIANTKIYLLDSRCNPVPRGAVGEIYIGGVGVARGYLNRPELTAERFVKDPFSSIEDARMYKTGDLGRYHRDGNLEFLRRNDDQVKIRGFRLELGDIESHLLAHHFVSEAVVEARENESGDKRLIAYVVVRDELPEEVDLPGTLRSYLSTRLPEFMVPAAFVQLERMPLSSNGKLDRKSLPAPRQDAFSRRMHEEPVGDMEKTLANLWQELLAVEKVGRHDNFFELGGHSLLAVRMVARLRKLGLKVDIRSLLTSPVLSELASSIDRHEEFLIPPNPITPDTALISPSMLPLIDLTQDDIDRIIKTVPDGISNIQDIYALTPLQDGILFHHLLTKENDPYVLSSQIILPSKSHLDRLLSAVQQIVNRHDILRTAFVWEGLSHPAQVVWRKASLPVIEIDKYPQDEAGATKLVSMDDPFDYRFNLTQAPLLRYVVSREPGSERWRVLQLQHHIIEDVSSIQNFYNEIRLILLGQGDSLPAPQPFRNLVAQTRVGMHQADHEHYFRRMLGDIEEPTLPFGLADIQNDGGDASESRRALPGQLNDRLRAQARRLGVSLASLCHLAWGQVLARSSGSDHVVFGTVLFGRMQQGGDAEQAVGLFINTLPLRLDLDCHGTEAAVKQTHARLAELLVHEYASLALAQRCSRVAAPTPLFSTILNYRHNRKLAAPSAKPSEVELLAGVEFLRSEERTNYPLTMSVEDFEDSLGLTAVAVHPLSPDSVCGYMHQALESLVAALEKSPYSPVSQLEILPADERKLLLEDWNATQASYPDEACLHHLIEHQAIKSPDAVAVSYSDQSLTYRELNARANQLAHHLIASGARPDDRIAVCMDRGLDMIIGLIGTLKAGAAYVPLDPAYPVARLEQILLDAAPKVVITDATGRTALRKNMFEHSTEVDLEGFHRLGAAAPSWADLPATNPDSRELELTSRNLAYVIYTSGSTGTPKGVMVEHQQLANFLSSMRALLGITKEDRMLALTSISFDIAGLELYLPLICGAEVIIASRPHATDPFALRDYLSDHRVTVMQATPAAWRALLDAHWTGSPDLMILCGGEALPVDVAIRLRRAGRSLWNLYGPTETTIYSTCAKISRHRDTNPAFTQSIGRPIANTRIYLLDTHGRPVPHGAVGELCIGGAGVARGYLNRPELTTERFLDDPFSPLARARMYKTGDLARYLPDGNLEFLGRNDHQVKIRGFRIELSEIEARLIDHPVVRQAVVVSASDHLGEKKLVAYILPQSGNDSNDYPNDVDTADLAAVLRRHLAERLPDYMVPAAFVSLKELPLTPNGKLDRKALPAPDGNAYVRHLYEAPRGEIEQALATLWQELLGVDTVGRYSNFFELGGHSLLAMRMMERLRQLSFNIDIRTVLTTPVLCEMAEALVRHHEEAVPPNQITADSSVITPAMLPLIDLSEEEIDRIIVKVPGGVSNIQDIYALSPLQDGILFHHLLARGGDPYMLSSQLAFPQRTQLDEFLVAVGRVIERHDILRTAIAWEGLSKPAQVVWRKAPLSITEVALDSQNGPIADQLAKMFSPSQYRMDLTEAPLLRFIVAKDADQDRWILMQCLHHMVGDHSTLDVFQREVYAFLSGRDGTLSPPAPFRNLVAQTRTESSSVEHERFFKDMLGQVEEPTLPFALGDVHLDGSEVQEARVMLPASFVDRLRAVARRIGVTVASLCHLAWGQVLARSSMTKQVVFGTVLFGRMQGSEYTAGLLINTLPLRVDIDDSGVEDAVQQVHLRLAELMMHEHASLALAQRCSAVQPPNPLFSAILNYRHNQNASTSHVHPASIDSLAGVTILRNEVRNNYPLTLSVEDFGDALGLTTLAIKPLVAARICAYMENTLNNLVSALEIAPDRPVQSLEILPAEERKLILEEFNATENSYPSHLCIHELFEAQVERKPEAVAVEYEGQSISYGDLNREANRLAHYLIRVGVTPDDRVAICVERGIAMIVSMLGVLKSGGAYVPLDPTHPTERIEQIVLDATPTLLLCDTEGRKALATMKSPVWRVIDLVSDRSAWNNEPDINPHVPSLGLTSSHLAYVLYTSGSTGTPKGVMVEHHSVVNFHHALKEMIYSDLSTQLRIGWNASFSFDMSIKGFSQLLSGHCLVLIPQEVRVSGAAMLGFLNDTQLDAFDSTPSQLKSMIAEGLLNTRSTHLRCVLLGGETIDSSLWKQLSECTSMKFYNMYGPTECTVDATIGVVGGQLPNIGRPIANVRIYLLDKNRQPVPLGAIGEIYIGGAGVARGYLDRPELTADRFLIDGFTSHPNSRIYKTGDLGRYRSDGAIEYLGRNDKQVKIRGFRIELGEIEARLQDHPAVSHAVVLAREDEPGEKRLVAYVVPTRVDMEHPDANDGSQSGAPVAELRRHLEAFLPEYMVPAAFVHLSELPLTPNGKLDWAALPIPEKDAYSWRTYEAPQGNVERELALLWQDLLGIDHVGRHDNFFEMGGHSLLAVQLVVKVRQKLGVNITVRDLFLSPSLKELSGIIGTGASDMKSNNLVPIRPQGTEHPLFLVHPGGGGIEYVRQLAPALPLNLPVYALEARGLAPGEEPLKTIREMAELYVRLIREVQPQGPYRIAGWSAGGTISYEMAQQLTDSGEEVQFVGLFDTYCRQEMTNFSLDLPETFDEKSEILQLVSVGVDDKTSRTLSSLAASDTFPELVKRIYDMDLVPVEFKALPRLEPATVRSALATRFSTRKAEHAYSFRKLSAPIWLFEAEENNPPTSEGWRAFLSNDIEVVRVGGRHTTMMQGTERLARLGSAISKALSSSRLSPSTTLPV